MSGAFAGERAVVVGLGSSGVAAARVLAEEGAEVLVTERRPAPDVAAQAAALEPLGVRVRAGGHEPEHLDGVTLVVASPGVPERAPVLGWAAERGLPVWSELELGARLCTVPYVAVTGTNGKSTTTDLIASMLREGGIDAAACGNIGHPFSLAAHEAYGALVVEASSFQLRFHRTFAPRVSVLLNLAPDHLDWHGSFDDYAAAKARVYERQRGDDVHVGNREDPVAAALSERAPCRVLWFRRGEPREGEVGVVDGRLVARREDAIPLGTPAVEGGAFLEDAAAAAAAALSFGAPPDAVGRALRAAGPLEHRGTVVAEARGVRFVDDSKATNPHAALAALAGRSDVVLIAGGLAKGVDLAPLLEATPRLAGVVAIGQAAPALLELFDGRVPIARADSIEEAVRLAHALAPAVGTVLLAPACASQDMFRDYRERGDRFASAARSLAREVSVGG